MTSKSDGFATGSHPELAMFTRLSLLGAMVATASAFAPAALPSLSRGSGSALLDPRNRLFGALAKDGSVAGSVRSGRNSGRAQGAAQGTNMVWLSRSCRPHSNTGSRWSCCGWGLVLASLRSHCVPGFRREDAQSAAEQRRPAKVVCMLVSIVAVSLLASSGTGGRLRLPLLEEKG